MANEEEDDYLSDKFLVEPTPSSSQPRTYAQRRQESLRQSRIKNEQNRVKSRRQREEESREEGLRRSLFERAKEDRSEGRENRALGIMLKMGFKIGQSLGRSEGSTAQQEDDQESHDFARQRDTLPDSTHRAEPLPLNEWTGKKGIGLGKRTRSPGASDRLEKMAKMAEDASKENFRDLGRQGYEERRAESRLIPAQRTCMTLDEAAGVTFNVLWMNPNDADSIPKGLMDALWDSAQDVFPDNETTRLRDQMHVDALRPVTTSEDDHDSFDRERNQAGQQEIFPAETVQETINFFRLGPRDRLGVVLAYLRNKYAYCFWCGIKYDNDDDLSKHCPGPSEEEHD